MSKPSSLTAEQRLAAVDLFEQGFGYASVSSSLGVSQTAVRKLEGRFKIWGRAALESKPTKQVYSFEFKVALVRQLNRTGFDGDSRYLISTSSLLVVSSA